MRARLLPGWRFNAPGFMLAQSVVSFMLKRFVFQHWLSHTVKKSLQLHFNQSCLKKYQLVNVIGLFCAFRH